MLAPLWLETPADAPAVLITGTPCVETEACACTTGTEPPPAGLVPAEMLLEEPPTEVEVCAVTPEVLAAVWLEVETAGTGAGLWTEADACTVTGAVVGALTDTEADIPGAVTATLLLVAGTDTAPAAVPAVFCVVEVTEDVVPDVVEMVEPSGPPAAHA